MKKVVFILLCTFFFVQIQAQSFMHGVGTGAAVNVMSGTETSYLGTLVYSPRFAITESENSSLTVGIPLTFGFSGSYDYSSYYGSRSSLRYLLNAPLILNMNWGAGSSKNSESRFGYFIGAGFGLNAANYYFQEEYLEKGRTTFGPAANGGVRIAVGKGTHNIEVLLSYMKGLNFEKPNTFGLQGIFNF